MQRLVLGFLAAVAFFIHASPASAGGVKWAKGKWSCKDASQAKPVDVKGKYSAPKGWVRAVDGEQPPCPRSIRIQSADGKAHVEFATVRARVSVKERASWHIQDAVISEKAGWTCGEGVAVDWNGKPGQPPQRVVRCAKALKDGSVIVGALMAEDALFAQLGGQKALLAALKAVTGLRAPLGQES